MSESILTDNKNTFVAPAMRMWDWFNTWGALQEATQWLVDAGELVLEQSILDESSPSHRRRMKQLRATGVVPKRAPEDMDPEEQHKFYTRHFKEILTDHTRMTPEESKARLAHVDKFRASKEGPEQVAAKPSRVMDSGHDLKSLTSASHVLHTLSAHKDTGHRLRYLASGQGALVDPSQLPSRKGAQGSDPEAAKAHHAALDATVHSLALTGAGEDVQPTTWKQQRKARELLSRRKATLVAAGKRELDPDHPHNHAAIAAETGMTEPEVKSIEAHDAAGTHQTPIRELARQMLRKTEGYTKKSTGEEVPPAKLDHKTVGSALSRILRSHKERDEKGRKGFLSRAVRRGSKPVPGADDSETTALDLAGDTPTPTRTALRIPKEQRGIKIHHPESKAAKAEPEVGKEAPVTSASPEHHAALIKALNPDADEDALKKKSKESVDLHDAIDKLYKHHGKSAAEIAKLTGHTLAGVEGHIIGKRSGPKGAVGGGGGTHGEPTVTKVAGKEQEAKKAKALSPSKAVAADLHDLYPLRAPAKEGESEEEKSKRHADFADKIKKMYEGDPSKGIPAKPHQSDVRTSPQKTVAEKASEQEAKRKEKQTVQRLGMHGSPLKAYAGFAGAGYGGLEHPGDLKSEPFEHKPFEPKHFDVEAARQKYKGKEDKVETARQRHEAQQAEARSKHETQRAEARSKYAEKTIAAQGEHKSKSETFHDTLAKAHEGVHKAMAPILSAMADPKHPENIRHATHHAELQRAHVAGDVDKAKAIEAEGRRTNIKSDLLDHHLNLAADKPEVQDALGVSTDKHARSALSNIFRRVEQHGAHYMKTAQSHGAGEQKASGGAETDPKRRLKDRPGDPFSRARVHVPGSESGAGGDIESGEHKPEKFIEPGERPTMASRVLDTRHQQDRSTHAQAALAKQQSAGGRARAQVRASQAPDISKLKRESLFKKPMDTTSEQKRREQADLGRAQKARESGAEPGTAGGVKPAGSEGKKLLRIRPTKPGTGSAITSPTTSHESPAKSGKEAFERLFGKTRKPGVVVQRASEGRKAPAANVSFSGAGAAQAAHAAFPSVVKKKKKEEERVKEPQPAAEKPEAPYSPIKLPPFAAPKAAKPKVRSSVPKQAPAPPPAEPSEKQEEGYGLTRSVLSLNEGRTLLSRLAGVS